MSGPGSKSFYKKTLTFLPGNFNFYRTFNNRRTGCLWSTKSKEIWMLTQKCTSCNDFFSRQLLIKDRACLISVAWSFLYFFSTAVASLLLIILKPVQKLLAILVNMWGHQGMVVSTSSEGKGSIFFFLKRNYLMRG